jgi:hypothetical protein
LFDIIKLHDKTYFVDCILTVEDVDENGRSLVDKDDDDNEKENNPQGSNQEERNLNDRAHNNSNLAGILEDGNMNKLSVTAKVKAKFEKYQAKLKTKFEKYQAKSEIKLYPTEDDNMN